MQDPNLIAANQREEIRSQLVNQIADSVTIINQILAFKTITVPVISSFINISENALDIKTKWVGGVEISSEEFKCQVRLSISCRN